MVQRHAHGNLVENRLPKIFSALYLQPYLDANTIKDLKFDYQAPYLGISCDFFFNVTLEFQIEIERAHNSECNAKRILKIHQGVQKL